MQKLTRDSSGLVPSLTNFGSNTQTPVDARQITAADRIKQSEMRGTKPVASAPTGRETVIKGLEELGKAHAEELNAVTIGRKVAQARLKTLIEKLCQDDESSAIRDVDLKKAVQKLTKLKDAANDIARLKASAKKDKQADVDLRAEVAQQKKAKADALRQLEQMTRERDEALERLNAILSIAADRGTPSSTKHPLDNNGDKASESKTPRKIRTLMPWGSSSESDKQPVVKRGRYRG